MKSLIQLVVLAVISVSGPLASAQTVSPRSCIAYGDTGNRTPCLVDKCMPPQSIADYNKIAGENLPVPAFTRCITNQDLGSTELCTREDCASVQDFKAACDRLGAKCSCQYTDATQSACKAP